MWTLSDLLVITNEQCRINSWKHFCLLSIGQKENPPRVKLDGGLFWVDVIYLLRPPPPSSPMGILIPLIIFIRLESDSRRIHVYYLSWSSLLTKKKPLPCMWARQRVEIVSKSISQPSSHLSPHLFAVRLLLFLRLSKLLSVRTFRPVIIIFNYRLLVKLSTTIFFNLVPSMA